MTGYALGLCVYRNVEKTNWKSPPPWLSGWDENPYVVRAQEGGVDKKVKPVHRFSELGAQLA